MKTKIQNIGIKRILLTYSKLYDIHRLRYLLVTGRLWTDYDIMILFGYNKFSDLLNEINYFIDSRIFENESIDNLKKANWITRDTIEITNKIHNLVNDNILKLMNN